MQSQHSDPAYWANRFAVNNAPVFQRALEVASMQLVVVYAWKKLRFEMWTQRPRN